MTDHGASPRRILVTRNMGFIGPVVVQHGRDLPTAGLVVDAVVHVAAVSNDPMGNRDDGDGPSLSR